MSFSWAPIESTSTSLRLENKHRNSILMMCHCLIWLVLLTGPAAREICFNQSESLPRPGWWCFISMEFLCLFLRPHQWWHHKMSAVFSGHWTVSVNHYALFNTLHLPVSGQFVVKVDLSAYVQRQESWNVEWVSQQMIVSHVAPGILIARGFTLVAKGGSFTNV